MRLDKGQITSGFWLKLIETAERRETNHSGKAIENNVKEVPTQGERTNSPEQIRCEQSKYPSCCHPRDLVRQGPSRAKG